MKNSTTSAHNQYYDEVIDAVVQQRAFFKFSFYYRMLTGDRELKHYEPWLNYLLDHYNQYRHTGFTDFESQINSMMDGLEALLK